MAKKKKEKDAGGDPHLSRFMVRLPERYKPVLKALAAKDRRPMTVIIQLAIDAFCKEKGVEPPSPS